LCCAVDTGINPPSCLDELFDAMLFCNVFTALSVLFAASMAPLASAVVRGISAPQTVYSLKPFNLTITTTPYPQEKLEYYVIIGLAGARLTKGYLGDHILGTFDFNSHRAVHYGTQRGTINVTLEVPNLPKDAYGSYHLEAVATSVIGAGQEVVLDTFHTPVNVQP